MKQGLYGCLLVQAAAFLLQCAGTQTAVTVMPHTWQAAFVGSAASFKGFGEINLEMDGERFRGSIDVDERGAEGFSCTCYDMFGGTVVSMCATDDTVWFKSGETLMSLAADQPLSSIPYFRQFPFTFRSLRRILTGRVPPDGMAGRSPDSTWVHGRRAYAQWSGDSLAVEAVVKKATGRIERISFSPCKSDASWRLTMSGFNNGMAEEIRFEGKGNNYFVIDKLRSNLKVSVKRHAE